MVVAYDGQALFSDQIIDLATQLSWKYLFSGPSLARHSLLVLGPVVKLLELATPGSPSPS